MLLKTIASGSSGNCYLLYKGDEILLLDAGVGVEEIKRSINYKISNVVGCIVTHKHL